MKVVFWSERYLPDIGGVEIFGAELIRELTSMGYSFSVITCKSSQAQSAYEEIDGVDVHRFPFHPPLYTKDLAGITRICREVSDLKRQIAPDIIHMNTTQPSIFYHVHTMSSVDCPTVVTIHSPPTFVEGPHSLYGRLVREAAAVTAVSDATRNALVDAVPDLAGRIVTVHNGLRAPRFDPGPIQFDPPHIAAVGRLVEDKGFDVALRAFRLFLDDNPTAKMTIAGDGPARQNLEDVAAALDLGETVTFAGWVSRENVPALMAAASMVVVPSRWQEPFGLVALQASQVARPVICSRVGGLPEVVVDGETGLVVPPEDPEALRVAMVALSTDPETASLLGAQGMERATTQFSMEACAARYHDTFISAA